MRKRRFAQVSSSDDGEDDDEPKLSHSLSTKEAKVRRRRNAPRRKGRKKIRIIEYDDEEDEEDQDKEESRSGVVKEEEENDETVQEDAKPIGEIVRVSGKGRSRRNHYESFEFDGNQFELEDPVLLSPEDEMQKPYVAIIKDISQKFDKKMSMWVTGQWFYRPEEAEKKGGGNWQARDTRELFYSFHRDEVPAESVMHKCVVHFIPLDKQLPIRKQFPGFIVQKVYDTEQRKLFKLTDKDYEHNKQQEIDVLVRKTVARLGDIPDIGMEDDSMVTEEQAKAKNLLRKKDVSPIDVSREDEGTAKFDQPSRPETPGSCPGNTSKYSSILVDCKALTNETLRDKWLERLLQGVEYVFTYCENSRGADKEIGKSGEAKQTFHDKCSNGGKSQQKGVKGDSQLIWPDSAVVAVTALEKASHEAFSLDFSKYNQKLRQLLFNLKNNALLAKRLLEGELEPSKILNMSPNELKEGLTAEEIARNQPEEVRRLQMTDARCKRCTEKKVGLVDIIQAGHGDRYQLECIACGNNWYASRDEAAMLTIDGPSNVSSVGAAPWASAKYEDMEEKKLVSPSEAEKDDVFKKSTEPYMPVLETQKSKLDENNIAPPKNPE